MLSLLLGILLANGQFGSAGEPSEQNGEPDLAQMLCIDHILTSGGPEPLNCTTVLALLASSPTPANGCETLFSPAGPNQHMCDLSCGFCDGKPKLIPPELNVLSPVRNGYYIQDSEHVKLECEIAGRDPSGISLAHFAQFCVTVTYVSHSSDISDVSDNASFDSSVEALSSVRESCVVHRECGNALQGEWRALTVSGQPSGEYVAHYELFDPVYGFVVSTAVPFFLHRRALQSAVFGDDTLDGNSDGSQRPHKPVLALAIKYGTQGDSTAVSVAVDGRLLLLVPLADLFRTHVRPVRRALAREQQLVNITDPENATTLRSRPQLTGVHMLSANDAQELSGHLALQAATGFANGCNGLYVTSAGVTRTCADPYRARQRWVAAANRIHAAVCALMPLDRQDNDVVSGLNSGGDSGIRINDHKHNEPVVRFDAAVFVSATEDARQDVTAPFEHAKYAFRGVQRWAFEDECEAVGDPSLLLWARDSAASVDLTSKTSAPAGSSEGRTSTSSKGGSTSTKNSSIEALHLQDLGTGVQPFPSALGVTAHTTSILKKLLRSVKRGGKPFTVCRLGYGWDTTLAHRRLVSPADTLGVFEALLLEQHTGVPIDSEDLYNNLNTLVDGLNCSHDDSAHLEGEAIDGNVRTKSRSKQQAAKKSSLEAYLDAWNSAVLGSCDVLAVYPATAGRVADYCAYGGKTRQINPVNSMAPAANNDVIDSSSNKDDGSSSHNRGKRSTHSGYSSNGRSSIRPCDTIDARHLGGVVQLADRDTWFYELRGLRVLVVSPFARTIEKQYAKHRRSLRDHANHSSSRGSESSNSRGSSGGLFPDNRYALPEFKSLVTLEPPVGKSRGQWPIGLAWTQAQLYAMADDFDVALVSAGGWGPLIQDFIAQTLGKSSIYMGGALQLHFGIWGGRYFNTSSLVNSLATPDWTWPDKAEAEAVEAGLILSGHEYAGESGDEPS